MPKQEHAEPLWDVRDWIFFAALALLTFLV